MGAKMGCLHYGWCIRQQNPNQCKENHSSTPGATKGHRRNLSAAFQFPCSPEDEVIPCDGQLNINTATEEELMTLPAINRQTAHNIVDYRRKLGGFKKVEDLALVSGVGATKLSNMRAEITVGGRPKVSKTNSTSSSLDNISRSSTHTKPLNTLAKVNVNSANVFSLMKVKGISQTLAENIVAHRDKKGSFKSLDDLVKVKGIKPGMLSAIRPYLVLDNNEEALEQLTTVSRTDSGCHFMQASPASSDPHNTSSESGNQIPNNNNNPSHGDSQEDLASLYGPLSRKSFRGNKRPILYNKHNRSVVRVASWNLDCFTSSKADNPGVKEVVALTLLENGLSIVAVQELLDTEALVKMCDELNTPTIPNVKKFLGHHGNWKCAFSSQPVKKRGDGTCEYLGFLYDESRGLQLSNLALLDRCRSCPTPFEDKILLVSFKLGSLELVVVNMNIDVTTLSDPSESANGFSLSHVQQAVEEFMPGEKDIILVGSFHTDNQHPAFVPWRQHGYQSPLVADKYTDISTRNPEGTKCQESLWVGSQLQKLSTGHSEVVREGLQSPWIPDGWAWGGVVSSHCPLWSEFYTAPVSQNGLQHQGLGDTSAQKTGLAAIKMTVPMIGAGDM